MTVNLTENNLEIPITQDKNANPAVQQKTDSILDTKKQENKEVDAQEDPNWKAFREARKKDREERQAAEHRAREKEAEVTALKAAMEAAFAKSPIVSQNQTYAGYQPEYQQEETEDERIEKKVQAAVAARELVNEKARLETEHQQYPNRLVQSYPDFNHVISQENLDYLDFHYPEVSRPLQRLRDGFDKWSDIYQAVKKFVPNNTTAKKEAAKADANFVKPKSISSMGLTQNTQSSGSVGLTDDRKASNWERMQRIMKGVG